MFALDFPLLPCDSGIKSGIIGNGIMSKAYNPQSVLRFRGKTYVLFKRSDSPSTPFSVRVQKDGKRRILSTGTADATLAKAVAKGLIAKLLDGDRVEPKKKAKLPTVGEVISAFHAADRHVRSRTAVDYELCLLRILREVHGLDADEAKKLSISVVNAELARRFQASKQGGGSVDFVTPRKVNTGINAAIRQAKGLFSRRALLAYEQAGLEIPDSVQGFLKTQTLRELSHRYSDNPIPKEQIARLNKDLPALKKKDKRLWAIHLMIRLMGLRDSEIDRARRHWLVKRGEGTFLVVNRREGEAAPKRSDGEVPVPDVLLEYFDSHTDDHLIPAKHPTERRNLIYKTHSKWVGERVPGRTKTNHELRKWAGSVVATKTNSWERAAEFLRIDIETAKMHYLSFVTPSKPLSLKDLMG